MKDKINLKQGLTIEGEEDGTCESDIGEGKAVRGQPGLHLEDITVRYYCNILLSDITVSQGSIWKILLENITVCHSSN